MRKLTKKELEDWLNTPGLDLNPTARMILLSLHSHAIYNDKPIRAYKSQKHMAVWAGCSENVAGDYVKALVRDGVLVPTGECATVVNGSVRHPLPIYNISPAEPQTSLIQRRKASKKALDNLRADNRMGQKDETNLTDSDRYESDTVDDESDTGTGTNLTEAWDESDTVGLKNPSKEPQVKNPTKEPVDALDKSRASDTDPDLSQKIKSKSSQLLEQVRQELSPILEVDDPSLISLEEEGSGAIEMYEGGADESDTVGLVSPERQEAQELGIEFYFNSHLAIPGWTEAKALRAAKKKAGIAQKGA